MFRICKKDLRLFVRDKRAVFLTFLLPIILVTLFALVFGGIGGGSGRSSSIGLPVADLDQSSGVRTILEILDSVKGLKLEEMDLETGKKQVVKGKYVGVLVFHKGFSDSLASGGHLPYELLYDQAREMEIGILQSVLVYNLQKAAVSIMANPPGRGGLQVRDSIGQALASGPGISEKGSASLKMTSIVGEKEPNPLGLVQAIAGTSILMLLFSVAGFGGGLLDEKEAGTLRKLMYSPINPNHILFGKMLAGICISILQLLVMFLFSMLALGLEIGNDWFPLLIMILVSGFTCSSFGILLASVAKTRKQVQGLANIIILIMSAVGGSMVPIYIMPQFMQNIAAFSINYWAIQGFYDILWRSLPLVEVLPRIFVLLGIGLVLTTASIYLFRKNVLHMV